MAARHPSTLLKSSPIYDTIEVIHEKVTLPKPARTLLPELEFCYDGAEDSVNTCPLCHELMFWHLLKPLTSPRYMVCEDCEIVCDCETEEVWLEVGVVQS